MTLTAGIALLVVAAVVLAFAASRLRRPARDAVAVEPEAEPEPVITWTAALTVTVLDEAARLRLIDDLMLLDAPWTFALLRRAYQEESSPQLRARIEAAVNQRLPTNAP